MPGFDIGSLSSDALVAVFQSLFQSMLRFLTTIIWRQFDLRYHGEVVDLHVAGGPVAVQNVKGRAADALGT